MKTRKPRAHYDPHVTEAMMVSLENAQQSLKSQYWLNWKPEIIPFQCRQLMARQCTRFANMDTTVFHAEYGTYGPTVRIKYPGTSLKFMTNVRFVELCMEPTKLPCPLQKIYPIFSEVSSASIYRLDPN